jgi:hypothetical protein
VRKIFPVGPTDVRKEGIPVGGWVNSDRPIDETGKVVRCLREFRLKVAPALFDGEFRGDSVDERNLR